MQRRIALWIFGLLLFALGLFVVAVIWVMPKLTAVDARNNAAAVFALDHTPLQHVQRVLWYTGGPLETTVIGTDAFDRTMYVFVHGEEATVVYQTSVLTQQRAARVVLRRWPDINIVSVLPGFIAPNVPTAFSSAARGGAVWEVTARQSGGSFLFAYVDMYTGRLLWSFSSQPQIHV